MELEFISEDGHGTSILSVEDAMELEFYQWGWPLNWNCISERRNGTRILSVGDVTVLEFYLWECQEPVILSMGDVIEL